MKATIAKKEWLDTSSSAPDHLKLQNKEVRKPNVDSRFHLPRDRLVQKQQPNLQHKQVGSVTDRAQIYRNGAEISNLRSKKGFSSQASPRTMYSSQPDRYLNVNASGRPPPPSRQKKKSGNSARLNVHRSTITPDRTPRDQLRQIHHTPSDPINDDMSGDGSGSTIQIISSTNKSLLMNTDSAISIDFSTETFAASSPKHQRLIEEGTRPMSDEVLQEALTSFIRNLPNAWMFPILRAATLQVMTEWLPIRIMTPSIIFDAYYEAKGELVHVLKSVVDPVGNAAAKPAKLDLSEGNSVMEEIKGPKMGTSPETITQAPSSNTSIQPENSHLGDSSGLVDLVGFQLVVPAILRFRLDYIKQSRIQELINHCDKDTQSCRELSTSAQAREAAAMQLFFDQDGDIQFGAHLWQGVQRSMKRGSRLLFPYSRGASTVDTPGNDPVNIPSWTAVSFENMPSIFLKAREDSNTWKAQQSKGDANSRSSNRRHRVHPFFTCEFAATLASGSDGGCIFASALAIEFFVGMPSFISQPMNCIASAIRATLHRMCLGVTKETLRRFSGQAVAQPHTLRMPPLDLALLYVRASQVYYASTTGIKGKLFCFNNGSQEGFSIDLCKDFLLENPEVSFFSSGNASEVHDTTPLDNTSSPGNPASFAPMDADPNKALPKDGTYDMPTVVRGFVDLSNFAPFTTMPSPTPREHGSGSKDTLNTLGVHHLLKKLTRNNPLHSRIVFPFAVVLGCSEFWSAISTTNVVDLLRTLILLDSEAASYTKTLRLEENDDSEEIEFVEEFSEIKRDRTVQNAVEHSIAVQQAGKIREYLNTLESTFSPDARARMLVFYNKRVTYYTQHCRFSKFDSSRIYAEELREMANERGKGGGTRNYDSSLISNNIQDSNFGTRISRTGVGAPPCDIGHNGETSMDPMQVKRQGPTSWRDFRRANAPGAAEELTLCDALASFLAIEASTACHEPSQDVPDGNRLVMDPDSISATATTLTSRTMPSMDCVVVPVPEDNATCRPLFKSSNARDGGIPPDVPELIKLEDLRASSGAFSNVGATLPTEGAEGGELYSVVVVLLPADIAFADAGRRARGLNTTHHARRSYSQKQPKQ